MQQKNWHLIRAAIFIILTFFILPEILPKIALHYSPGGLRMPTAPYLNAGLLAVFMVIAVFLKNYNNLENVRGPKLWEFIVFTALAAMEFAWFTGLLFAIAETLFWHFFLAGLAYGSGMLFLMIALLRLHAIHGRDTIPRLNFSHSRKNSFCVHAHIVEFNARRTATDKRGWVCDGN